MLGLVYSKEAPDGGKTKGTSHYPPWGTCTPKLHFSALLLILSTCSPLECTALSLSCSRLSCSIFYRFLFSTFPLYPYFITLNFTCLPPPRCLSCSASPAPSPSRSHLQDPLSLPPSLSSRCFLPSSSLPVSPGVRRHVSASSEQNLLLTEAEARWRLRDGSRKLQWSLWNPYIYISFVS